MLGFACLLFSSYHLCLWVAGRRSMPAECRPGCGCFGCGPRCSQTQPNLVPHCTLSGACVVCWGLTSDLGDREKWKWERAEWTGWAKRVFWSFPSMWEGGGGPACLSDHRDSISKCYHHCPWTAWSSWGHRGHLSMTRGKWGCWGSVSHTDTGCGIPLQALNVVREWGGYKQVWACLGKEMNSWPEIISNGQ